MTSGVSTAGVVEQLLRRDRLIVFTGLILLTTLAWTYLYYLTTQMSMGSNSLPGIISSSSTGLESAYPGDGMAMPDLMKLTPWTAIDALFMFLMWAVMMLGMMLPSATPMILLYARVVRHGAKNTEPLIHTSAFLAVALEEASRDRIIELTYGYDLISPDVLPFEVGNALSSLLRKGVLKAGTATGIWDIIADIPVELKAVDIRSAIALADKHRIYAYDAYFLECAHHWRSPLLTLDRKLARLAESIGIDVMEIDT